MNPICRLTDIDSSSHKMLECSDNVTADGLGVSRIGDKDDHSLLQDHVPHLWDNKISTARTTTSVFVNGKPVLRTGDIDDNTHGQFNKDLGLIGDAMVFGSPTVFAG